MSVSHSANHVTLVWRTEAETKRLDFKTTKILTWCFLSHLQVGPQKWMLSFLQLEKQFCTLPQSSGSHPQLSWRTVNKPTMTCWWSHTSGLCSVSPASAFLVILDSIQDPETKPVSIQCKLDTCFYSTSSSGTIRITKQIFENLNLSQWKGIQRKTSSLINLKRIQIHKSILTIWKKEIPNMSLKRSVMFKSEKYFLQTSICQFHIHLLSGLHGV